jgi:hypothetical protein
MKKWKGAGLQALELFTNEEYFDADELIALGKKLRKGKSK